LNNPKLNLNSCNCPKTLCVDDDLFNLKVVKKALKEFGLESEEALNG
jgi:CheY-like chemotaxis protein